MGCGSILSRTVQAVAILTNASLDVPFQRLMGKLTKALAQLCLHVDLDQYAAEAEGTLGRRRVFSSAGGSRPTPSAHDSSLPPTISSSPDPDKKLSAKNRATSTEVLSERSSRAASGNSGQPPRLSDFGSVQSLALTTQTAMFAWKNVLCILGNPNSIQSPIIQADAVKAAVNIYDMLALIRACQPYKGVPLPPMYDFITWIFQACAMSPEYAEGRAAAYGCVCRMLCRRHDHRMGDELFAHFYQLVIRGLAGSDLSIIFAIVNNATRLFGLQLPGSDVLIVPFLRCFRRLFFGDHRLSSFNPTEVPQRASDASQSIPEIVRQNAAIILSSIAAMCNKAPEGSCPILNFAEGPQKVAGERPNATELAAIVDHGQEMPLDRHEGELPLVEAKGMVKNLIFGLLQDNTVSQRLDDRATSHRYLLNAACSLAYEELVLVVKLDRTLVEECLNVLLGHLHQHNLPAVNAAVDCLNLFSQSFPHLSRLDGNAAFGVVEKIVGAIQEHLAANPPSRNQELIRACIVARLFYCLLDWLLCVPSKWFHNTRFVQLVFDTIEAGLSEGGPPPGSGKLRRNGPPSDGKNRRTPRVGEDSSSDIAKSGSQLSLDEDGNDQETSLIRDAAENVLMHVLHHVDNFPPTNGPAMMNT